MAKKNGVVEISFDSYLAAYCEYGVKVSPECTNYARSQQSTIEQSETQIQRDNDTIKSTEQSLKENARQKRHALNRLRVAKFESWSKKFGAIDRSNIVEGFKLMLTSGKGVRNYRNAYENYCRRKAQLQVKIEETTFDLKKQTEKKEEATTHLTNYQKLIQERLSAYTNVVALKKLLDEKKELLHTLPANIKDQVLDFFNEIKKGFVVDIRVHVDQMPLVQKAATLIASLGTNTKGKFLESKQAVTKKINDRAEQYQLHGNQFHQLTADPEPSR